MIVQDFKAAIEHHLPSNQHESTIHSTKENDPDSLADKTTSMENELALHRSYAANKARFFAGREKYLDMLGDCILLFYLCV